MQGTPYRIIGGLRFYERAEIRDAVAYMRVMHQPADDLAFERIVNLPRRGVGEMALRTMHEAARAQGDPAGAGGRGPGPRGRAEGKDAGGAGPGLFQGLARWRVAVAQVGHVQVAEMVLEESGYHGDVAPGQVAGCARGALENLREFVRALGGLRERGRVPGPCEPGDGERGELGRATGSR